ncbi:hypothetical protein NAP1_04480 [Erythrobacter sp. NAP1]|uniref:hypothetical protein n=1 Tax=Erythrobacter sp. NAP1 TaxID=237727 RepID=UPI000068699C|nr:hypothetical protein [Erythrobacter sp. NAP1]EAQ30002.1 hypothetical protein NAP1_04480 [Erythrobacter sp. NAP1]
MRLKTALARLPIVALTILAVSAVPVQAQVSRVDDVAFFERAQVGPIELTPFGIVRDQRCADARFCYRTNDMLVSVIVRDRGIPYEIVLRLGQQVEAPGGFLVLRDTGTRPRERGALPLSEYALDIEFIPVPRRDDRQAGPAPLPRP